MCCLPTWLVCVKSVNTRKTFEAQAVRLLRVLLLWECGVPINSEGARGEAGLGTMAVSH
jgi:hypothetical protein